MRLPKACVSSKEIAFDSTLLFCSSYSRPWLRSGAASVQQAFGAQTMPAALLYLLIPKSSFNISPFMIVHRSLERCYVALWLVGERSHHGYSDSAQNLGDLVRQI